MLEGSVVTERYEVLRRIGAGGMGVVYEAVDHERGQNVALKTISNPGVEGLYRLKREFRVLADLGHPNLVTLYDLVVDGGSCFFTMELLDGSDFLSYLWPSRSIDVDTDAETALGDLRIQATSDASTGEAFAPTVQSVVVPSPCNHERLRQALPQLTRGLHALHLAGKIHRDVKPSNIRVTGDGRVVLLDFGLVTELDLRSSSSDHGDVVGTAAYMAPEQCAGEVRLTPAADWYALGVSLFLALTGRLPFEGTLPMVALKKQTAVAPRPSDFAHGVPDDLAEFCQELLERDPSDRPSGRAILRRLGLDTGGDAILHVPVSSGDSSFGGREAELSRLDAALARVERGEASAAVVRGHSGMGKTALVGRFFERAQAAHADLLVLGGRCFEREDIPYKAIDGLIDELSDWWRELSPREAQALLPRDASLLPTLFPVLGRVPVVASAPTVKRPADPQALRTRAFAALRDTFQRLADRQRLVLFLDDMQWVDRDTTALLADLLRAPDPPALLLVLSAREDGAAPVVELARRMDAEVGIVEVGPLDESAALRIATQQLGRGREEVARRLVTEAGGSPFFLMELTRYLHGHDLDAIAGRGLDAMLTERITGLGDDARRLAELVVLAGEPVARKVLERAASLAPADVARQLSLLRAQRIVRTSSSANDDVVEPYHGRVRDALWSSLSPQRRGEIHRTLAVGLEAFGDDEQLARHWYAAGDLARAAEHARRAGARAQGKLDFDRAARFYAIALEADSWAEADRLELAMQLGDCLADAGRPREAADHFLAVAGDADEVLALELRRRAAGVLLQSGYVDEGLEHTREVLDGVGMRLPSTPNRALASMLMRRAWLRCRGLGYTPRALEDVEQRELTRVDVCEGVSFGLALVDSFRSMDFAARFLQQALQLGEPWRVSRALALEADLLAALGARKRALHLVERLEVLTAEIGTPAATAQLMTTQGMVDFFLENRFRDARDRLTEATNLYRSEVGRAGFELDSVSLFTCWSIYYLGDIAELARRVPAMAEAASRSGNRHTAVTLRCAFPMAWLAGLDVDEVDDMVTEAIGSWATPGGAYQLQHLLALCSRVDLALYRGEPEAAGALIDAAWKPIRRALVDRPPLHELLLRSTVGRQALACAARAPDGSSERAQLLASVRRHARRCRGIPLPVARASAALLEAAAAEVGGHCEQAVARYRVCLASFEALEVELFAPAVRARLGALLGGDEGAALQARAHEGLAAQGVDDPDRTLAMLLPGAGC